MAGIVLASGSPRRQELLQRMGLREFEISVPDVEETFPEPAPAAQELGADAEQELDPVPDIKELEEGTPPEEGEEERAGHGLFAHVRPLILDGEDLDLPPALRKKKPDPS